MVRRVGEGEYYKAATGTYATPKLYKSAGVALAATRRRRRFGEQWEAVPVTLIIGEPVKA